MFNSQGYPPPEIHWYRVLIVRGRRKEVPIVEERPRLTIETFQLSSTTSTSRLIIRNATFDDGGVYMCAAKSGHVPDVSDTEGIKVQEGPGSNCIDRPSYTHCDKVKNIKEGSSLEDPKPFTFSSSSSI